MTKLRWFAGAGAGALPLLAISTVALAQGQAAPSNAETTNLDEIVVSAQKRSENLQDVPIVITAVSSTQLTNAGVTSVPSLSLLAPGLNIRTSAGGVLQPSIRAIGTSSNVVENPVALYVDGVYLPQQQEGNRDLPDVDQVAILKGPQGTLFGRNATGGVIQITTSKPSQTFRFKAKAEVDNYETVRTGVFVSGGLAEGVAASLSADYAAQGKGYGDNLVTGDDTFQLLRSVSLRGKLVVDAGPDTSITLVADYMSRKTRTYTFVPYPGTSFVLPLAGPAGDKRDTYSQIDPYAAFRGGGVSMTIEHDLGAAKLVSITAYRKGQANYLFDNVPTGTPIFYVGVDKGDQPSESFTQELQVISSGDGPFTYAAGVFYFYNSNANLPIRRQFFPPFYGPAGPAPAANRVTETYGEETARSIAPYGQVGLEVFKDTTLTLGARYTYEKRELEGHTVLTRYNGTTATLPFTPAPLTIRKPTWRVALDHRFNPDLLAYVSYNRGIKSGGFNILNPANPAYLPERLDAYEAGIKSQLFDDRLRLNVGGFYYDYANLQVTQFVNLAQSVVNGAQARIYGLDVDFNARLTPELTLNGGFELMHAEFTSYPNAVGSIPKATGGATLIVVDATGNRIPQAQEFVATVAADYERPIAQGSIHANLTANYSGDYKFEADNYLTQKAYLLLNASLGWKSPDQRYGLTLWVRNLLDETIINNTTSQAVGYPTSYGGPPRTFGLTAKVDF